MQGMSTYLVFMCYIFNYDQIHGMEVKMNAININYFTSKLIFKYFVFAPLIIAACILLFGCSEAPQPPPS